MNPMLTEASIHHILEKNTHYFASLTPDAKMIEATKKKLQAELTADDNIHILAGMTPLGEIFAEQIKDKKNWLRVHTPHIDTDAGL